MAMHPGDNLPLLAASSKEAVDGKAASLVEWETPDGCVVTCAAGQVSLQIIWILSVKL